MSFMEIVLHYRISGDDGAKAGDLHKLQLSGSYFEHGHPLTRRLIALLSAIQVGWCLFCLLTSKNGTKFLSTEKEVH